VRLSPDAVTWVARNLVAGVRPGDLVAALVEGGVPVAVARRGVEHVAGSEVTPALVASMNACDRARAVADLAQGLRTTSPIEELSACPPAATFFARYWAANTPVVLRGFLAAWARRPAWSFDDLRLRFGEVEVEAAWGRDAFADPDRDFAHVRRKVRLGDLLDVIARGPSNDTYLVARNRALAEGPLSALLDEIEPPSDLIDPALRGTGVSLWLGPAGTLSKLHHDATNNILTQVLGEKRVRLVSPHVLSIGDAADGFYARTTAREVAREVPGAVIEVVLREGDGVFLPVGWWHEIESLSPSLSLALVGFRRPNDYDFIAGRRRSG
jgi:hypothetical protein